MTDRLSSEMLHATTVAKDGRAVIIAGRSGSGKSDLALRLFDRGFVLVSDDQTMVRKDGDRLVASAPPTIKGKLEVRGIGIVEVEIGRRRAGLPDRRTVRGDRAHARGRTATNDARRRHAADRHRRDRARRPPPRSRSRSIGLGLARMTDAVLAPPVAGHRHVGRGQVDRARRARGHGLGLRRQPARRLARRLRPRRAQAPASACRSRSGWMREAAASTPSACPTSSARSRACGPRSSISIAPGPSLSAATTKPAAAIRWRSTGRRKTASPAIAA